MTVAIAEQAARRPASAAPAARGSSFYTALRILPAEQREAMFRVYAFCRAVDDIADREGPRAERMAELERWRQDIAELYTGTYVSEHLRTLASVIGYFGLERSDFDAVIDGMWMDAEREIRAPDWATLDLYCDRVASAVGRLSVRIFGVPQPQGRLLSHHLGRALQLTNILRDLDDDAAIGRLYLPREALEDAGIRTTEPAEVVRHPNLARACAPLIARAREHFAQAARIMTSCPRPTVRSPRVMASVYADILERLGRRGFAPPRRRIRPGKFRVVLAVLRHGVV